MKFIKLSMLTALVFLAFNCSTEDTNNPIEEQNITVEQDATRGKRPGLLVTWRKTTTEAQKQYVRNSYVNYFIDWYACDSTGLTEIWQAYCFNCQPQQDPEDGNTRIYVQSTIGPAEDCGSSSTGGL